MGTVRHLEVDSSLCRYQNLSQSEGSTHVAWLNAWPLQKSANVMTVSNSEKKTWPEHFKYTATTPKCIRNVNNTGELFILHSSRWISGHF